MLRFFNKLNELDDLEYMKHFVSYLIAPVITGIKPSSTITLNDDKRNLYTNWVNCGEKFIKSLGLDCEVMKTLDSGAVILVYNKQVLENYLYIEKHKDFLCNLGYTSVNNLSSCLKCLKNKFEKCEFPHETGLFLGFPIEDVMEFMNNNKNCLFCGYWKVYSNKEYAKEIFNLYDKSKILLTNGILDDLPLEYAIKNILNIFILNEQASLAI